MKDLDCSKADRGCNNKLVELSSRDRAGVTEENEAVLKKREWSILVCIEIVEKVALSIPIHLFDLCKGLRGNLHMQAY